MKLAICLNDRAMMSHGYEVTPVSYFNSLRQTHEKDKKKKTEPRRVLLASRRDY